MSAEMSDQQEILFQGAKPYWRTRNTMDVTLVLHLDFDVIEVISYEPLFDVEAPRIYLDNRTIHSKLDYEEINRKLDEMKEPIIRKHEVPDSESLLKDILRKAKTDYILNRLFIVDFDIGRQVVKMEIQLNFRDSDDATFDINKLICEAPIGLKIFKTSHFHAVREGEVDQVLASLEKDKPAPLDTAAANNNNNNSQSTTSTLKIRTTPTNGSSSSSSNSATPNRPNSRAGFAESPSAARVPFRRQPTGRTPMSRTNTAATSSFLLAGITASMKRRFRGSVAGASSEDEENDPSNSVKSPAANKLKSKPAGVSLEPASPNSRSITSRSFVAASPQAKRAASRSSTSTSASAATVSRFGDASPAGERDCGEGEGDGDGEELDTFESGSFSQRISAGFSAFSTSIKRTLSFRRKSVTAEMLKEMLVAEADEDKELGFESEAPPPAAAAAAATATEAGLTIDTTESALNNTGPAAVKTGDLPQTKLYQKEIAVVSRSPTSFKPSPKAGAGGRKMTNNFPASPANRTSGSVRSGATLDISRSTGGASASGSAVAVVATAAREEVDQEEEQELAQTPAEFRDALIKKQSECTARSYSAFALSAASFRENNYALPAESATSSKSPIVQFFQKMAPWAQSSNSGKVSPVHTASE